MPLLWSRTLRGESAISLGVAFVATDHAANVYVAGALKGVVDFGGKRIGERGVSRGFVASYSREGALRWVRDFNQSSISGVAVDGDQQVCVLGSGDYSSALPPVQNPEQDNGLTFVACTGLDGVIRWTRKFAEFPDALAFDGEGNLVVALREPSSTERSDEAVLLSSFAPQGGAPRWTKRLEESGSGFVSMKQHPDKGVVFVGGFAKAEDADSSTRFQSHVIKLEPDGAMRWSVRQDNPHFPWSLVTTRVGDTLAQFGSYLQRIDSAGTPLARYDAKKASGALSDGFVFATASPGPNELDWYLEQLADNLTTVSQTTHGATNAGQTGRTFGSVAVAETGEIYAAAIAGELLELARFDAPQ